MDVLSRPASEFENDHSLELLWAEKAYEHAEVYFNMLCSVDPRYLNLTPHDDVIYRTFRKEFPDFDVAEVNEDELKSTAEKAKWRIFIEKFNKLENFSYGTLLRPRSSEEFSADNAILVVRIQFLAIEIARNREGFNDRWRKRPNPQKASTN
ncbi:protein PBDC1 [Phlebotomus argentipes]|uniref:protein PBDC1 n=1 Tax=Phlebotomus argentipes TaxID=94469 RepID=UPI00289375A9|nr:protein PBDC1 [Phlebotomus argentipes]